jgi:hypothetical protein
MHYGDCTGIMLCAHVSFTQLGGGQTAAAAHRSAHIVKAFLAGYDRSAAHQRQQKASTRSLFNFRGGESTRNGVAKDVPSITLPPGDEELVGTTSAVNPWAWLLDASSGAAAHVPDALSPPPLSLRAGMDSPDITDVAAGSSKELDTAALDHAGPWVLRPAWSSMMTDALDSVSAAQVRQALL